ncbi:7-cyano-7-deazaguanine synthase QueC [Telmatocola sphagniphila]|uniref:7-cyano-7-deazaguanine synthase n=1 Tax=Telmatocola sphagniphila TaxID=1123043 RepID=A0A8E6B8G7_9BACT|nr:7-cyano-7-deazaguanine synthase QueC [Telmatocola sphagniphila]QVL33066.1 7-cyano-7-deazaguanine synthase QueC [Telmatocola sphagniphila]
MKKAVVLLSGGLDSATTLAIAQEQEYAVYALSVDYGQRHKVELQRAAQFAESRKVHEHKTVAIDLRTFGGSALTANIDVPKNRSSDQMSHGIPVTYVPARNTILLSLCLGYAETVGAYDLFIGANILDYSGYPDCRPAFLEAFANLANLATKAGVEGTAKFQVHAPLIQMTKAEIIRKGIALGIDYAQTLSCYDPDESGRSCGKCDSCLLRAKGFAEAGVTDPTTYKS